MVQNAPKPRRSTKRRTSSDEDRSEAHASETHDGTNEGSAASNGTSPNGGPTPGNGLTPSSLSPGSASPGNLFTSVDSPSRLASSSATSNDSPSPGNTFTSAASSSSLSLSEAHPAGELSTMGAPSPMGGPSVGITHPPGSTLSPTGGPSPGLGLSSAGGPSPTGGPSPNGGQTNGGTPSGGGGGSPPNAPNVLKRATRQYMISSVGGATAASLGIQSSSPVGLGQLRETLRILSVDVTGMVPGPLPTTLAAGQGVSGGFYVANIEPARAEALKNNLPANIAIEENHRLGYGDPPTAATESRTSLKLAAAGVTQTFPITLRVVGHGGMPIANAPVQLASDGLSEGRTDQNGMVTVNLFLAPGGRARLLYVDIPSDHWDIYIKDPAIVPGQSYEVRAKSLYEAPEIAPNFPNEFNYGWGQRLMELDRLPANLDGAGVRIAIIDSGADNTHPLLQHIRQGFDATQASMTTGSWMLDTIGHGTHCAGVITAQPANGHAMRGFAPAAEIIIFKIFPGGDFISLAKCINRCVELQVDIINLSLGAPIGTNLAVEQTMEAAVRSGISFVVAAGNDGADVRYPASSQYAMAVAAIGAQGMFPDDTYDESTMDPSLPMVNALFSPNFTCRGPKVAVGAPGVSIISSVPGGGYNPESGTSMAAPHVTGLGALLLAHHPIFRTQFRERNAARVNALYQLIRSICAPIPFGADRVGSGLPRLGGIAATLVPSQPQPAANTGFPIGAGIPAAPMFFGAGQPIPQAGLLVPQAMGGPIFVPMQLGG